MPYLICFLYILKDLTAVISLYLIFLNFFSAEKRKGKIRIVLTPVFLVTALGLTNCFLRDMLDNPYEISDGISFLFYFAATPFLLKKVKSVPLFLFTGIYVFSVDMLWSFTANLIVQNIVFELCFNIIFYSTVCVLIFVLKKTNPLLSLNGIFNNTPKWIIICLLIFELTCYYKEFGISSKWYDFLYSVSAVLVVCCVIYLVYLIVKLLNKQNKIMQNLSEQLEYNEMTVNSDENLRKFRHDLKNHIIVLNSMFEQGDYSGAEKYFSEISTNVRCDTERVSTGNTIVNSLITVKQNIADKSNTNIVFTGLIPQNIINNVDMCTCIGNLLDNAIEECAKDGSDINKTIKISAAVKNSVLLISVTNPIINIKNMPAGLISFSETSKTDKKNHGIGLKNVKAVAEKYNGSLTFEQEAGELTANLLLFFQNVN